MLKIFVASKNPILPAYLLLFLKEFAEGKDFTLVSDKKAKTDLLIIDTETISAEESKSIISDRSVILFSIHIKPFLINYTSLYDINGVISLDMEPEGVTKTLDAVSAGDIYYNEEMISILFSQKMNDLSEKVASITSRETDIIQLMMNDLSNEEIATQLGLSIRTVNAHKGNIMRKLGAQTTAGMIKIMMDYAPHII